MRQPEGQFEMVIPAMPAWAEAGRVDVPARRLRVPATMKARTRTGREARAGKISSVLTLSRP